MQNTFKLKILAFIVFAIFVQNKVYALENCKWDNKSGTPCIIVSKTPNTSIYSSEGIIKKIITKEEIDNSGAKDVNDVLKSISGFSVYQDGPVGQKTSVFTRGSESNHTMVLLNGIAINDQSVTDGLHDFGQDFLHSIQQIEIYKGPSGAHFGPSAIAGAVNLITDIDYKNKLSIGGSGKKNNSINANYTKLTDDGWHLNFKASTLQNKTNSAKSAGSEDDGTKNYQANINVKKIINDNLKFKSTFYSRKTKSNYDNSAAKETGYLADNKMHAIQAGLESFSKNKEDSLIFHYHNYDRDYEDGGDLDEYGSKSLVAKAERKIKYTDNISFGFGNEYKYDWGSFENRGSYTQSTKGHMKDMGIFANVGLKLNQDSILSLYGRSDDHNTTGGNQTYKLNFTKNINKFKFGATHSTGLRNPTLYELYGSNNYGYKGNTNLDPEKSKVNEITGIYNFSDNLSVNLAAYKTKIFDRIEDNGSYTASENKKTDLNQEGLESELLYKVADQTFSFFTNFSKSKNTKGQSQLRRPDLTYGSSYTKRFLNDSIGPFDLNIGYKYTAQHVDINDAGGRIKMKSTDIMNMTISKTFMDSVFSINVSNLLNEKYERPATYGQPERQITLNFKRIY